MKSLRKKLGEMVGINPLRWTASVRDVLAFADQIATHSAQHAGAVPAKRSIGIVVNCWLTTWVPWYSIIVGLLLSSRGNKIVFIFDDLPFSDSPVVSAFIRSCIRRVLRRLSRRHWVITVSEHLSGDAPMPRDAGAHINRLAELNAVHRMRGEMVAEGRAAYTALVHGQLTAAFPAIAATLDKIECDAVVVPGGVYGTSGLWLYAGTERGIRVSSFDAGSGIMLLAAHGIAAQLQDIPRGFEQLKRHGEGAELDSFMVMKARGEIEKRHGGRSAFNYQQAAKSERALDPYKGAVLIALNSSWDQAALGLHVVFRNSAEWIVESVRWILQNTESSVVVRQHPSERFELTRTTDDYEKLLRGEFGANSRVHFIAAADPINTYDLLSVASCVLAYTSTFGVEATALRKPTIVASSCYYANLGFVWSDRSAESYFDHLAQAIRGDLLVTPARERDALLCYYATQVCNWIFTPFNPVSDDFFRRSVADLSAARDVDLILEVIETGTPACVLNHQRSIQETPIDMQPVNA